jgi:hypothetical protein
MITRNLPWRKAAALLVGPALLAVLGCSDSDNIGKLYPVSGTVKYKSEPVAKARISFTPTDAKGHGATGQVENGSFTLTTLKPNDGILLGEYKVTVDDRETDNEELKAKANEIATKKGNEKFGGGAVIPQDLQAKAMQSAKGRLPGKYQLPTSTDLTITIKEDTKTLNIDLKD